MEPEISAINESYEWQLSDNELETIYNGNIGDYLSCSIAMNTPIMHQSTNHDTHITWNLCLYPTGNDHHTAQFAYLSIHTRSIPLNINNVIIQYSVTLQEMNLNWSQTNVNINNKRLFHTLQSETMLQSQQLKQLTQCTFKIGIKINRIIFKPSKRSEPPSAPINNNYTHRYNNYNKITNDASTVNEVNDTNVNDNMVESDSDDDDLLLEYHKTRFGDNANEDKEEDNIVDDGLIAQYIEYDCFPPCIIPTFDYCIKWTIRKQEFDRFLHTETRTSFDMNYFYIGQFRFKLSAFPNGHKEAFRGMVIIYLDIERIPVNVKNISIHWMFRCLQTGTTATSIKDLHNSRLGVMVWSPNSLKLEQLQDIQRVTFILQLNIFKIEYYSKPINSQFQHIHQLNANKKYLAVDNKKFCHESSVLIWKLNFMMINAIKNCHSGQSFESPQFDIWIIKLSPKGTHHNQDKCMLSLKILPYYLHHDIQGVVARIVLECTDLNIEWNDIGSFVRKSAKHSCRFDISDILSWHHFGNMQNHSISFEFKVEILKLFGFRNQEIGVKEKYEYLKRDNNDKNEWDVMRTIRDLQNELAETKTELMELKLNENEIKEEANEENENKKWIESDDVESWFKETVKLPQYFSKFVDDGFEDFDTISEIKEQDLIEMNIDKKGHRRKITKCIQQIKDFINL